MEYKKRYIRRKMKNGEDDSTLKSPILTAAGVIYSECMQSIGFDFDRRCNSYGSREKVGG